MGETMITVSHSRVTRMGTEMTLSLSLEACDADHLLVTSAVGGVFVPTEQALNSVQHADLGVAARVVRRRDAGLAAPHVAQARSAAAVPA